MGKDLSPIVKRSRRLGIVLGKEKYVRRRQYPPGIHGPKQGQQRPRTSSYGEQLIEKQKAKAIYGILERQFQRYFDLASHHEGNTGDLMLQMLEQRLDNVVFRLGFSKTRRQARQMVSHGFIQVNGNRVDIPSCSVNVGDEISIKVSKKEKGIVKQIPEAMKAAQMPKWLSRDDQAMTGKVTNLPERDDTDQQFDSTLIVEFYSR